jgi:tetratricopeptide (TPR) repeat protein
VNTFLHWHHWTWQSLKRRADAETLALRAAIFYKLDRHAESAAEYRKALKFYPQRTLWLTGLAVALEQDGQSTQALEAFQRAAKLPLDKPVETYVKQRTHILSNSVWRMKFSSVC